MWIILAVLAAILALVLTVLFFPISIIIKKPAGQQFTFSFKVLGFYIDENTFKKPKRKKKNSSGFKNLTKITGLDKFNPKTLKEDIKKRGFFNTVSTVLGVVCDLVKEVVELLYHVKAKRFLLNIVCAEEDAAETALTYGKCCAAVYPVIGYLGSIIKMPEKVCDIKVSSDFSLGKGSLELNLELSVALFWILASGIKIIVNQTVKQTKARLKGEEKKQTYTNKKSR